MSTVSHLPQPGSLQAVVAGEIRAWMGRRNVNQTALAQALGVSQSQISKRLKGTVPFDIVELEKVARFLGVSVAGLVGAPEGGTTPPPDPGVSLSQDTCEYNYSQGSPAGVAA